MNRAYRNTGLKIFFLIALLAAGAFAQPQQAAAAAGGALGGVRWELAELNGKSLAPPKKSNGAGGRAFVEFDPAARRFAGSAGCNRIFGAFEAAGRRLEFGPVAGTKMMCADGAAMTVERDFTAALGRVTRYRKSGATLSLYAGRALVLKFRAAPKTAEDARRPVALEDRKWMLEAIGADPVGKLETAPFLNFDRAKGAAGGDTGCNAFGGNYAVDGARIKFSQIFATMRACVEDERMTVERGFKDGLERADRYEIAAGRLRLYAGPALLLTFRAGEK